jgi:GntR family transcriptional regulator
MPADDIAPAALGRPPESVPRYRWIREHLLKRIVDGKLKRGDPIESEGQIAKLFGVSLGTVRKAVDELVAQNVLERQQGRGTFVASRNSTSSMRLSFHVVGEDDVHELPAFKDLLAVDTRPAAQEEMKQLRLPARSNVVDMLRTRSFSDGAVMLERVLLPAKLFPNFEKRLADHRPILLYEFYEQAFGVSVMDFEERVCAVSASREDAKVIGCDAGAALLEIRRVAYGFDDRPVEMRISRCETNGRYYLRARR